MVVTYSVGILRGVRVVVEPCHEDDAVDDHLPLRLEHGFDILRECRPNNAILLGNHLSLPGINELLRFRETASKKTREE